VLAEQEPAGHRRDGGFQAEQDAEDALRCPAHRHQEAGPAFAGLLAHDFDIVLSEEYPGTARPPVPGARTQLLANDELFVVFPDHGQHAARGEPDAHVRLADLAGIPWIFDPPDTGPGQWARNACREVGFEPDVRYAASDLLLQIHLAETGHAAAVIPGLLLAAVPRPKAGRPSAMPSARQAEANHGAELAYESKLFGITRFPLQQDRQPHAYQRVGPGQCRNRSPPARATAADVWRPGSPR
jgi:DNA-binding transcriptional LysR family regulator